MKITSIFLLSLTLLLTPSVQGSDARDRAIKLEIQVAAPVKKVWEAWTTPTGIKTFFGKGCNVELRVHGPYEIFFNPDGPRGRRGDAFTRTAQVTLAPLWNLL